MRNHRWIAMVGAFGVAVSLAASGCGPKVEDNCTGVAGTICTWAGTGGAALSEVGTHRAAAELYQPIEIEFAPDGTPYIADWNNHRVIRIVEDEIFLAMGAEVPGDGPEDRSDLTDPGAEPELVALNHPTDIAFDSAGRAFSTNWHNHKIRVYDPATDLVKVLCGRAPGYAGDGLVTDPATRLRFPHSIAIDTDDTIYFVDAGNDRIRRIRTDGVIETFAGDGMQGFNGDGLPALMTRFSFPLGTLFDSEPGGALTIGPDGNLYVADFQNHRIRMIDVTNDVVTTIAGSYTPPADVTAVPPPGGAYSGDGGPAVDAELNFPRDLAFGPDGNLYISDTYNHAIRKVDLTTGTITTVAGGNGAGFGGDGAAATDALLDWPAGISFGPDSDLYIADQLNHRIRKVEM